MAALPFPSCRQTCNTRKNEVSISFIVIQQITNLFEKREVILNSFLLRLELCSFSGYKIYPGHGKRMVKADGKVWLF